MINEATIKYLIALTFAGVAAAAPPAPSPGYSVLVYLPGGAYIGPAGILEGSPGTFYTVGYGPALFSVALRGTLTTLATFASPPYTITSNPTPAANELFYSATTVGGKGAHANVFSVGSAAGTEQVYPSQTLTPGLAGNLPSGELFGIACPVGVSGACSLALTSTQGGVTPLYQFPSTDTVFQPIYGADGNYYGTAYTYGVAGTYFYQVTPSGSFTKVAVMPFGTSGFVGVGLILRGSDGNFYGIQSTGVGCSASNQHGAVYKLTPGGQFSILHDFGVCGNGVVNTLIQASDGKLYGAVQGSGALFSLTTSGAYKELFRTSNGDTQGICPCYLLQGSDGKIYGMASGGGPHGDGLLFSLDVGLPRPEPSALKFSPASGSPGTKVRVWGYNMLGASAQFNGAPATNVYNSGANYVWATVPEGATTGPITITTKGGSAATVASFTVE